MLQPRRELDFPFKPLGTERGGELGVEHFERDRAIVLQVVGEEHGRHPATAELTLDAVAVTKGQPETFREVSRAARPWCRGVQHSRRKDRTRAPAPAASVRAAATPLPTSELLHSVDDFCRVSFGTGSVEVREGAAESESAIVSDSRVR